MPQINRYAYWQKALKGEQPPERNDDEIAGYYRVEQRNNDRSLVWHPVGIVYEGDEPVLYAGFLKNELRDKDKIIEIFSRCSHYPIPYKEIYERVAGGDADFPPLYKTRLSTGQINSGVIWTPAIGQELLAKAEKKAAKKKIVDETKPAEIVQANAPENERAVIGDNSGATEPLTADAKVLAQVNDALDKFSAWLKTIGGKVETDDQEKVAAGYAREFRDLRLAAEKAHKAEKEPILKAGREIDSKWKSIISASVDGAAKAVSAADAHVKARQERAREEQRKADQAAMEARAAAPVGTVIVQQPVVGQSSGGFKSKPVKVVVIDDIEAVKKYFISTGAGTDAARDWALRNGKDIAIPGTHVEDKEEARV